MSLTTKVVLADINRIPGNYLSPLEIVPLNTTRIGVAIDRTRLVELANNSEGVQFYVEVSTDGGKTWQLAGGAGTKSGTKRNKQGDVITESHFVARLPRDIIGKNLLARVKISVNKEFPTYAKIIYDDQPIPKIPVTEHQSVTYDSDQEISGVGVSSLTTPSLTVANNTNRYLIVGSATWDTSDADQVISSVTFNGSTHSFAQKAAYNYFTDWVKLWGTIAPTVTAATVVITYAGTLSECAINALSAYNVDQTTPLGTPNGASGTATTATVTVANVAATDLLYDVVYSNTNGTPAVGADQTARMSIVTGTAFLASTQSGAAGGVMSWYDAQFTEWVITAVAMKEVAAGGVSIPVMLAGIGMGGMGEPDLMTGGLTE